jgi:hypothetical protein
MKKSVAKSKPQMGRFRNAGMDFAGFDAAADENLFTLLFKIAP